MHAIEYAWLEAMRTTTLYAYRRPAEKFAAFEQYAQMRVEPLGPAEPAGDLLACHTDAGIQLRVLDNLWPFWDAVTASSVGVSVIRLRNAAPRPASYRRPRRRSPALPGW